MKRLVCESLRQFYKLNEDIETAKQIFADGNKSSNDKLYKEFFELLSDVPEEDIDVYAEWVVNAGIDPDYIENELKQLEVNELTLDKPASNFSSFRDFRTYIREKIEEKQEKEKQENVDPEEIKGQKDITNTEKSIEINKTTKAPHTTYSTPPMHISTNLSSIKRQREKNPHAHSFTPDQVEYLINWFNDCRNKQAFIGDKPFDVNLKAEKYLPKQYIYYIDNVSIEDVANGNCEADYIYTGEDYWIGRLKQGLQPILKSGSATRTGNPFKTINDTSSRESGGKKVILSVYYAPRRKDDVSDLDHKYHPKMLNSTKIYFKNVSGNQRFDAGREWFYIDGNPYVDKIKEEVIKEVLGTKGFTRKAPPLNPNKEQQRPKRDLSHLLIKNKNTNKAITIFLGYKCRYPGKTITVLNAFADQESKYLIVFSRRKNIAESWERNAKFFPNVEYVDLKKFGTTSIDPNKKYLIVGTVQSLENREIKSQDEDSKENIQSDIQQEESIPNEKLQEYFDSFLNKTQNQTFWIGLDEAHQGGLADATVTILKKFAEDPKCKVRWDISGTGLKLYDNNSYDKQYHYDIIDEEEDKEKYIKKYNLKYDTSNSVLPYLPDNDKNWIKTINNINIQKDPDARVIKSPKKLTYVIDHSIVDPAELHEIELINNNEGVPGMIHLLSRNKRGNVRFPKSVRNMVDWILGEGKYGDAEISQKHFNKGFINEDNQDYLSNWGLMCFTSRVEGAEILEEYFKIYKYVDIIKAFGGDSGISQEQINREIKWSLMKSRLPIVISCGAHGEGSDFEQIIATFHIDNGISGENKTQRGFRGATPFIGQSKIGGLEIIKAVHIDVYFDMIQALKIASTQIINNHKESKKSSKKSLGRVIEQYRKACPIYSVGLGMKQLDSLEYPTKIREAMNLSKTKNDIIPKFDVNELPLGFFDNINPVLLKGLSSLMELGKKGKKRGKGDKSKSKSSSSSNSKDSKERINIQEEFNIFRENLIRALEAFTTRPYFNFNSFLSIEDLFSKMTDKSFIANLGVTKETYKLLIEINALNKDSLNYYISTRDKIIESSKIKYTKSINDMFINMSEEIQKSQKDPFSFYVGTKSDLVNEMMYKLSKKITKNKFNKNLTILDPEIKNGEFLLGSIKMMNELLESVIPVNRDRIQWIIDNNIYGFSNEETNIKGFILLLKEGFFKKLNLDFTKLTEHIKYINNINEINTNMKFDVIIGNPPFQLGKNSNFYVEFFKKSKEILNSSGIFSLISPNAFLLTDNVGNKALTSLFNPVYVKHRTYNFPGIGTAIGYFIAYPEVYNNNTKVEFNDKTINIDISKLPTPRNGDSIDKIISDRILSKEPKLVFDSVDNGGFFVLRQMKRWNSITGIGGTHILNIIKKEDIKSTDGKWVNLPKNQISTAKWYLTKSKAIRYITYLYAAMNTPPLIWNLMPMINFNKKWTDDELYRYFNLSDAEIDHIENIIK